MTYLRQCIYVAALMGCWTSVLHAQTKSADQLWRSLDANAVPTERVAAVEATVAAFQPVRSRLFELDPIRLTALTTQAVTEEAVRQNPLTVTADKTISLPLPDGSYQIFELIESPVMSAALQAKFPEIRSYRGRSVNDPSLTMRMDVSPLGLHAQILGAEGTVIVDPTPIANQYQAYVKRLSRGNSQLFRCSVAGRTNEAAARPANTVSLSSGTQLRTYRLAVACTGEYAQRFGGTVPAAMAAINTTVNRVVGIYEREVAVRLILVDNNDQLIFTKPNTDPFTNDNANRLIDQSQTEIDRRIGDANYDIGHTFSTGAGGLAQLGCVGVSGLKGQGVTGRDDPVGDPFDVDYVAHEMGHQFGGDHTFNGVTDNCSGGTRNAVTAVEPGSGSTIQAYAGICGGDDLQANSDAYFHGISLDQILAHTTLGAGNVAVVTPTGNGIPTVTAGADVTIPKATPFRLVAQGSDPNGDRLSYCWEQFDIGPAAAASQTDDGFIPLFRSFSPSPQNERVFPKWADILNQTHTVGEQLPKRARTMSFRVTVRDGRSGGGGVNSDTQVIKVDGTAGPFTVAQPAGNSVVGRLMEVQWKVAGTDAAPINCQKVNIRLSTDGGANFNDTLALNTPNDGKALVALPATSSSNLRWSVEAADNVFLAVNTANVSIAPAKVEIYLSRHAEKGPGNDPDLTTEGKLRANRLSQLMKTAGITRVYATHWRRAQQTAAPTAAALGVTVNTYDNEAELLTTLRGLTTGERVLVVGHSDTVPTMVNQLTGSQSAQPIGDNEFDRLFFVGLTDAAPQFAALRMQLDPPTESPSTPAVAASGVARQAVIAPPSESVAPVVNDESPSPSSQPTVARQMAQRIGVASVVESVTAFRTMQQNWSVEEADEFYSLRQGSPLMHRPFFDALEQAGSTQLFRSNDNMRRFGFLPRPKSGNNPDGYPIGFVGRESIELNCSACHTSQLKFGGTSYLVDGGQAMTDLEGFQRELAEAMEMTLADAPAVSSLPSLGRVTLDLNTKFGRFARALLNTNSPMASQVRVIQSLLQRDYDRRQTYNDYNDFGKRMSSSAERSAATRHIAYGYGRLDALGGILNQATAVALGQEENARPSNAPVNYPCIWDAPQHVHVQWNGAVDNTQTFGPLGRNAGQVIGVFGIVKTEDTLIGYESSINFDALKRAEELITKLWSPAWPAEFGLDKDLAKTGQVVYQKNCITCHAHMQRDDRNRRANDVLVPIETNFGPYAILATDDLVAKNWRDRQSKVGPLAGRNETIPLRGTFPSSPNTQVFARDILSHMVFNAIARSFVPWREELNIDDTASARMFSESVPVSLMRYKSRPLNGVWSTAPYLHNGSVLDMQQLLTKPADRLKSFQVGSVEFDARTLGFKNEGPSTLDTSLPGNRNTGHDYGTDLSESDKLALIEYIKTL